MFASTAAMGGYMLIAGETISWSWFFPCVLFAVVAVLLFFGS
jgi:hypothetical protein